MATYDFGDSATPVKKADAKKTYDFGDSATAKNKVVAPEKSDEPVSLMSPMVGAAEAGLNMATGMIAKPVSEIAGMAALGKELISPTSGGGDPQGFQREVQDKMTYAPRTSMGKAAAKYNPVTAVGSVVNKVGDVAGDIVGGDAPADSVRGMAGNAVREGVKQGAGFIGAKGGIGAGIDAIPKNIKLTPEMTAVNKAAKGMGIELLPHQLSENKYAKVAGAELAKVPLSGSKDAANKIKWNQALAKEIGADGKAEYLTPEVYDRAMRQSGATIGRVTGKYNLKISKDLLTKIDEVKKNLGTETSDNARIVNNMIDELNSKVKGGKPAPASSILGPDGKPLAPSSPTVVPDGVVDGVTFRKFNSKLSERIRKTTDGDLKNALSDLQDNLLETFNEGIENKADAGALKTARMQYAKAKDIAGIVGNPKGVSPTALRAQIRNTKFKKELYARGKSSMKDLADVGDLLRDPNTSLTAERGLLYKAAGAGVGGGAAMAAPVAAGAGLAGLWGTANAYNRLGNRLVPTDVPPLPPRGPRKPGMLDYSLVPRLPQDQNGGE